MAIKKTLEQQLADVQKQETALATQKSLIKIK
jgi:hypothetical protein